MGRVWLIVVMSLWIATLGNLALWRELGNLPELQGPKGLSFKIAFGVGIAGVAAALLALFNWRHVFKPVLTILLVATALGVYFMLTYGVVLDPGMMTNVLQTDWRETRDLLNLRLLMAVGAIAVVPLLWIIPHALRTHPWKSQLWRNLLILIAGLGLAVAALMTHYQEFASVMRNHTKLRYLINPMNSLFSLGVLAAKPLKSPPGPLQAVGTDATLGDKLHAPQSPPPLVLVVLGETARAANFSLNGYARPTNPQLAAEGVLSFRQAWSCGTSTATSVPCMFSADGQSEFNDSQPQEGLVDVLRRAGLDVLWLDNQSGCKGVCDRVPNVAPPDWKDPALCDGDGCFDEIMVKQLDQQIARKLPDNARAKGTVVFLHMMGSHGPAYYKRSPPAFKRFQPECASNALPECQREQVVNAYDNSLVYTDHVLASAIAWLKAKGRDRPTALVYVSDHGESLGENNVYLHGLPYRLAPAEQKRVPWITWLSPAFERQRGLNAKCLRRYVDMPISHDHFFHSVLGLLDVNTATRKSTLDIYGSCAS